MGILIIKESVSDCYGNADADKVWENNLVITENDVSRERDKWPLTVGIVYSNCQEKKKRK